MNSGGAITELELSRALYCRSLRQGPSQLFHYKFASFFSPHQKAVQKGSLLCGCDTEELQSIQWQEEVPVPEESSHSPSEAAARPACSASLQGATGGEAERGGGKKKRGGRKVQSLAYITLLPVPC